MQSADLGGIDYWERIGGMSAVSRSVSKDAASCLVGEREQDTRDERRGGKRNMNRMTYCGSECSCFIVSREE